MNSLGQGQADNREKPAKNRALPDRAEDGEGRAEVGGGGWIIRTVVVDDSPMVLKTLSSFLQLQHDFQLVGSATDGRHAVRRVVELQPDLVLMDFRLPGINGLEATRQIKARSQAPAVIMVSADDTPECRAAASAAGTDGFVGKQHLFSQLREAIKKLFPGTTI